MEERGGRRTSAGKTGNESEEARRLVGGWETSRLWCSGGVGSWPVRVSARQEMGYRLGGKRRRASARLSPSLPALLLSFCPALLPSLYPAFMSASPSLFSLLLCTETLRTRCGCSEGE